MYGSWTRYDQILHNGEIDVWRYAVAGGATCPVCFGEKLMTWPANGPVEAPEDCTTACPLCCENEFSELP